MADGGERNRAWPTLVSIGAVAVVSAVILEIINLGYHQVTTVTVNSHLTTTVTGLGAPPIGVITVVLGAGMVLLFAAAFFTRISKIDVPAFGLSIELGAEVAAKAAVAAKGDPENREDL